MHLFAADLFALAFLFKTFSCLALIPSVGVMRPSVDETADAGLSVDFEAKGIVSFGRLVLTFDLLCRRPLDLMSASAGATAGVARSLRSTKSTRVVRNESKGLSYHRTLHFLIPISYSLIAFVSLFLLLCLNRNLLQRHTPTIQ